MNNNEIHIDPLTHLPNGFHLEIDLKRELVRAEDANLHFALLYLNLDFFKRVNDCYGGDIGDLLLVEVGQRLAKIIRSHDFLAHLGGDNFAVILTEVESTQEVAHIAQRIIEDFNNAFVIDNHVIFTGLSIGIAYYPDAGNDATELHKSASIALSCAKELGRNNYQFKTDLPSIENF